MQSAHSIRYSERSILWRMVVLARRQETDCGGNERDQLLSAAIVAETCRPIADCSTSHGLEFDPAFGNRMTDHLSQYLK